uniref:DUF3437 domain-containing protein n=1 Tax=Elaeophora elaphi TaxID=1147741 RepID=A0A0R3RU02_9BILA
MLRKYRSKSESDILESGIEKNEISERKILVKAVTIKTSEFQKAVPPKTIGNGGVDADGISQLDVTKYPVKSAEWFESENVNDPKIGELILDSVESSSRKKSDKAVDSIISSVDSNANTKKLLDRSNSRVVKSSTIVVEGSVKLISGVLRVPVRQIKTEQGTFLLDPGSEIESAEESKDSEEAEVSMESEERTLPESSGPKTPCCPGISNLEVISVITELLNFQYRKESKIMFENVKDIKQYLGTQFLSNRSSFFINNIFDIGTYLDNSSQAEIAFELYESVVRTVLLYSRMHGFLVLRCIVDNPPFNTAIYEETDIVREMDFLKSVYDEAEKSECLKRQRARKEFISCHFLFDIVKLIEKNEIRRLLEKGVVKTREPCSFFFPHLFAITAKDVEQLYETDLAIVTHFDLLTQYRFFTSSLHTAQRTLETKPLVMKYVNTRIQLSFFKLLIRHVKALSMENLDKLTDSKLSSEENRKDDRCYNALQVQEMIRSEFSTWKGAEKAFHFLPTIMEYLLGRKEPKNKTSLNIYHFIKEFLMVIPHTEFISRQYGYFIARLCMDQESHGSILNPAILINRILIPNLKRPIRKVCAAVTLGNLLESRHVNIAWSFDYTGQNTGSHDDENITSQADESYYGAKKKKEKKLTVSHTLESLAEVEVVQLIGAFYSQYTFPQRNTIRFTRYLFIDLVLSKLNNRLSDLIAENSFTSNALKYLDELVAEKQFPWQADYYLSKILLRNLLAARTVDVPERPADEADRQAWIEWTAKLLPITYAGVKSKPFFSLAFLIDSHVENVDLESAFVLHFNDIPEFSFIEFLVLFKIFMRSGKNSRLSNLCKHAPGSFGNDRSLRDMVKWLFRVINRVQKADKVNENVVLKAKHRVLQWAEAYVANSKIISTSDTKAILGLLKWKDEPGLKDDELDRGLNRLFYEVCHKCVMRPNDAVLEIIQQWSPCENILEEMEYFLNHIPPSRPSEVKVYNPTRLLQYKPAHRDELTPWEQCQFKKFLHETIDFQRLGGGSRMRERPKSGSGMYGYARPMYVWSIDGFKQVPYSSMKNDYEDVPSDLSELTKKKKLPFDLQAEVGSVWRTSPARCPEIPPPLLPKHTSSQSVNLPILQDANEVFQMQILYNPHTPTRRNFDHELDFGASAANFGGIVDVKRSYSLPSDLSTLNLRTEKIVPRSKCGSEIVEFGVGKHRSRIRQRRMQMRTTDVSRKPPTRRSDSEKMEIKLERTLFHPFLENIGSCSVCGLADHAENFCPDTPNYSNLLNTLMPVTYKWSIKKEKSFENFHRQDSWGCFGDGDN